LYYFYQIFYLLATSSWLHVITDPQFSSGWFDLVAQRHWSH